jgi:hypothetical protein
MYICDVYESSLKFYCQRFSNNNHPIFTDQELLTVYLFCGAYQQYFKIKDIPLPRNTCFHGSLTCLLTKHSIID